MKRVYIVHRWGADSTSDWIPWLREELESNGITVTSPDMPDTNSPTMDVWISFLSSLVSNPDGETYFVGHSIGCQAILRYLSGLPDNTVVGGAVLVAPWTKLTNLESGSENIAKPWLETPIEWDNAKSHSKNFTVIYSDDDKYVPIENAEIFEEHLNARLILDSKRGHFTEEDDVTQLPIVLKEVLSLTKAEF